MESLTRVCDFGGSKWLLFGENVAPLVYYSHLPIIAIAVFLSFFILLNNRKRLSNQILFFTIFSFASWVFLDSIFWATNRSDVIMFVWSVIVLIEPLVYVGSFYFLYLLIDKKDLPFKYKLPLFLIYLPLIIFAPTKYNLSGFDLNACLSTEGPLALYYSYGLEFLMTIIILFYSVHKLYTMASRRYEILSLSVGTILFLSAFAWGNIIGSFTENWQLAQFGLFGMPIFAGFFVYSIVKFKTFNIKLIATKALVISILILIVSMFAVRTIENIRIILTVTSILFLVFGMLLIRSVKREIKQKEQIEKLAFDLQRSNNNQTELIRFITHQVKGFFTKSRSIFSGLIEGDYGNLPEEAKSITEEGLRSDTKGVESVQQILHAADIRRGTVTYEKKSFDFKQVVEEETKKQTLPAEAKNLQLNIEIEDGDYSMIGDKAQMSHAIRNLVDNSIKYTPEGSVVVSLKKDVNKIVFKIKDTGIGINNEDKEKLFTEGGRGKDSIKINTDSTGYGLYIVKNIIEAHNGKVSAESDGEGKGSTFVIELTQN